MNAHDTFKSDLNRGKKVERKVLEMVRAIYPEAYIVDGYCKDGDIYIPPPEDDWVEVKYDPMSKQTGNIVIEIEFNGKPSALATTKSYRWVFFTDDEYIIASPERLKKMIEDNNLKPAKFTGRGDTCPKLAYLVKKKLVMDTAILIINA